MHEALEEYLMQHTAPEPEHLAQLARLTHLRTKMPQMLSGHVQGRFLSLLSHLMKPKNVLEIGTFTGYSAVCLAEGLAEGGQLVTVDHDAERALWVNPLIAESPYGNKIQPVTEPAVSFLSRVPREPWDMVFIDADKMEYPTYLELIAPHIRSGGLLLADNVLWYGKVIDEKEMEPATQQLRLFNDALAARDDFQSVMLLLRDGLTLARKK